MLPKKWWAVAGILLILIISACSNNQDSSEDKDDQTDEAPNETTQEVVNDPPSLDDLEDSPEAEYIRYGEKLMKETNTVMADYVGNELSCTSCHADGGLSNVSSFVGVTTQFPQYRKREGVVFTIEDRINGCMIRSMNGEKIPYDSKEMRSMLAYLNYISEGIKEGADIPWRMQNKMEEVSKPDLARGEEVYEQSCMSCHASDGSGTGPNSGPALWGENSFNDGAGMTYLSKMAGFVKRNMPIGQENSLTDQEATDVSAYILSHERPLYKNHEKDFPHGGRPDDQMNKERREQIQNGTFDWSTIDNIVMPSE